MYGYDNTIDYMPATEGIGDWARGVLDWIREQGKNIKAFIDKIVAKIKKFMHKPTADEYKDDSAKAPTLINEISNNIGKLIRNCVNSINNLYDDYQNLLSKDSEPAPFFTDKPINVKNVRKSKVTAHKGMDKLYEKQNELSASDKKKWNKRKDSYYKEFADYSKISVELREKLTELSGMALSYNALKTGYTTLKSIFGMNGKFGTEWATIVVGHDWSTGEIRKHLNNVVKMYKTGINATNALGRKLSATKTRDDNGKPVDNPNEMEYNKKTDTEKAITAKYMRKVARKNGDDRKAYTDARYVVSEESLSIFNDDYFATEDCDIYDEELGMALEDAYNDGYAQALLDMDADPDDIAEENVDMFDDYYDEAMENRAIYDTDGNPVNNKAKRRENWDARGAQWSSKDNTIKSNRIYGKITGNGPDSKQFGRRTRHETIRDFRDLDLMADGKDYDLDNKYDIHRRKFDAVDRLRKKGRPLTYKNIVHEMNHPSK